jgi:hypothetical protein
MFFKLLLLLGGLPGIVISERIPQLGDITTDLGSFPTPATQLNPRALSNALQIRQTCGSEGEATCEQSCMPLDAVCCNDGSSTFCPFGDVCIPNGCCPVGETCSGGGGTVTFNNPATPSPSPNNPAPASTANFGDTTTDLGSFPTGLGDATTGLGSFPTSFEVATTGFFSITTGFGATSTALGSLPTNNPFAGMPTLPSSIEAILITAAPTNALQDPCQLTATPAWVQSLPSDVRSGLASYENAVQSWFSANSAKLGTMTSVPGVCTSGAGAKATSANSKGAAPRPTTIGASLAGAVGLLGVMIAL